MDKWQRIELRAW